MSIDVQSVTCILIAAIHNYETLTMYTYTTMQVLVREQQFVTQRSTVMCNIKFYHRGKCVLQLRMSDKATPSFVIFH